MSSFRMLLAPMLRAVVLEQREFALFVLTTYTRIGNFQHVVKKYSFIEVLLVIDQITLPNAITSFHMLLAPMLRAVVLEQR